MILVNSQLPGDSVMDCIKYSIYTYQFYREFDTAIILRNGPIACRFWHKVIYSFVGMAFSKRIFLKHKVVI